MQNSMFDPAYILIHGEPVVNYRLIPGLFGFPGASVTVIVPGGTHKGIHSVGFPFAGSAAKGTKGIYKPGAVRQGRAAGWFKFNVHGEHNRQVFFRDRDRPAFIAVNNRNGSPPVALPGNQPVPEAVVHPEPAFPDLFQFPGNGLHTLPVGQSIELTGIDQVAFPFVSCRHGGRFELVPGWLNDHTDRVIILPGKLKVALIVGGNTHNASSAVF
ncbi:MAG: hypothetical protein BWY80_00959 [Firmicutes bacterium ADurb.Bin456]|nr:MAG: hypothetical protein BWY80_00959 [Firmicutes bacterium ADurb.Bin456]